MEHNANDIWNSVQSVIAGAFIESGIKADQIEGIGITNQRETTVIWDRETGIPIYNAIVWQSRQTTPIANQLKDAGYTEMIREKKQGFLKLMRIFQRLKFAGYSTMLTAHRSVLKRRSAVWYDRILGLSGS